MDRYRWRIVRVDEQLVRVMQYCDPPEDWGEVFAHEPHSASTRPVPPRRAHGEQPAQVVDLGRYRMCRERRHV